MGGRASVRAAAVLVAVFATAGVVAALAARDDSPGEAGDDRSPAPERFLGAWERSREATYRLEADFRRESNSTGAVLTDHFVVAQRPPDRMSIDRDGATGLVDGRRIACTVAAAGDLRCRDAQARRTYDDDVTRQLETLRSYVTGDDVLYDVTDGDEGCFVLALARTLPAPPLGERATFCFDPDLGAPTLTRIERVEADDETVTVAVTGEVTDADFDPEALDHGE
jgi:hypothetical protein